MSARLNHRRRHPLLGVLRWTLLLGGLLLLGLFGAVAVFYGHAASSVPPVPAFDSLRPRGATFLHARDGQVIGEFHDDDRLHLDLRFEDVPLGIMYALLAAEDERFFEHTGFDLRGFARAAWTNLVAGRFVEGASTISQQLAKDILGRPDSFGDEPWVALHQKARETAFARRMHGVYAPEQILLLYLNRVYFGRGAYGIRSAASAYFAKDLGDLSLTEMAFLAGLPQSPSRLDPSKQPERARRRTTHVLTQMARNGFITEAERDAAIALAPPAAVPRRSAASRQRAGAPYFTAAVLRELRQRFGEPEEPEAWRRRELRVDCTVDLAAQRLAERHLAAGLHELDRAQGYRGPLLHLEGEDRERLAARVAAELGAAEPAPGELWPALVRAVDTKGLTFALGARAPEALPLSAMAWAGVYDEKKPSFGRKLKDPRERFQPGDVILVERDDDGYRLAQEPKVEGALVLLDRQTDELRALQGGYDFDRSEVDRSRSVRQTGSAIKPAFYALAYDRGLSPSTVLSGAPFREGDYSPTQGEAAHDMLVWDALTASENNISLRIMNYVQQRADLEGLNDWARRLGLDQPLQGYTAEVLGTDQTPLGLTRMMATFAERGRQIAPRFIRKVTDAQGRVLVRPASFQDPMNTPVDVLDALIHTVARPAPRAIPEATAYLVAANLREVFRRGTAHKEGRRLRPAACGKTGTLGYDVWFTGFTAEFSATVWVGADRRERLLGAGRKRSRVYGANTALPIWRDFLNAVSAPGPGLDPVGPPPDDVVVVAVDPATGWLVPSGGRDIPHRQGSEPTRQAPTSPDPVDTEVLQMEF